MRKVRFIILAALLAAVALPTAALATHESPHKVITHGTVVYGSGRVAATAAASGSSSPGVVYGGLSTQHEPIMLRLSRDHRKVVSAAITWNGNCSNPSDFFFETAIIPLPAKISSTGRFAMLASRSFDEGNGITGNEALAYSGSLKKDRLISGTVSGSLTDKDQAGNVVEQCSSGIVRYTAVQ